MKIKLAAIQQPGFSLPEKAFEHTAQAVSEASTQGAQLCLLPELHTTPYFCQTQDPSHFAIAEDIPGPTTDQLGQLAKKYQCIIIGSIFEKRTTGIYHNTAVVLDVDGHIAGTYRKMHIPDDPGFHEKYYFTPGDTGFIPIKTSLASLGVLVCWDQWFPEAARLMALNGAQLLLYPTAIGWCPGETDKVQKADLDAWITIQRAHAIANHLPVISCNRVGQEYTKDKKHYLNFWGNSFICDARGQMLAHTDTKPSLITATIDLNDTSTHRHTWPYFRDRRTEAYSGLQSLCPKG